MKKLALALALTAIVVAPQAGRSAGPTQVQVQGRIAPALRIVPISALDFGLIVVDGVAGLKTDTIDPAGTETLDPAYQQVGAPAAGVFELRGRQNGTVSSLTVALDTDLACGTDTDPLTDCLGGGDTNIEVSLPTWSPTASLITPIALSGGPGLGVASISYGATISIDGLQEPGLYTGTLVVTAAY